MSAKSTYLQNITSSLFLLVLPAQKCLAADSPLSETPLTKLMASKNFYWQHDNTRTVLWDDYKKALHECSSKEHADICNEGKKRGARLAAIAHDDQTSLHNRIYACLLLLDRTQQYLAAKKGIFEKEKPLYYDSNRKEFD
ncbi:MAG: hypothetical protein K2X50_08535, partial [Gammaproteobacteria bacterium]|nr:hypothetical protein [Gammaproteobacteria bacterium]